MDFTLDDDLRALAELSGRILTDFGEPAHLAKVEADHGGVDWQLWAALAEAGLLGIAVPERVGGAGMGMLGLVTLLEQQGRSVTPVPLWSTAVAMQALVQFGSAELVDHWLPELLTGSTVLSCAFATSPGETAVATATANGAGWLVRGDLGPVPAGDIAEAILLPAVTEGGELIMVVLRTKQTGVHITRIGVTSRESYALVCLDGAQVDAGQRLPGDGSRILEWTVRRARVALAALQLGVCAQALRMTADYTAKRVQFGRPLATNQAVTQRAADGYLDVEGIRLTTQRAALLMDGEHTDEEPKAALTAKWWAATAGLRVVHTAQHLHGGIGADIDYPIHRYFLWGRQLAFTMGSAGAIAAELGIELAHGASIGAPALTEPRHTEPAS
ncbi:alkylation response protein AidB-like acyl-CoA dehydrogenase [Tamaricihabitans halophyticus]|uniref:Alkylation response protein AidB-like acyl-CoA dehydrogenase n=1 Tax=Tamaricihabitans halophyticus TaxID=1262583 RepID=A0A4R2QB28_9PSEU|nr:acyl-CoA dehydrogenase family protein [Tamaricihabitans halophyticus]TCP45749.1 alkylation response protein AidB-like acyl-CoA dehydrogenase [Tamaricihabitans halophyticus]